MEDEEGDMEENPYYKKDAKTASFRSFNFAHVESTFLKDFEFYSKQLQRYSVAKAAPSKAIFV